MHLGIGTMVWPLAIVLGFVLFTDTRDCRYRFFGGSTHALAHLGAATGSPKARARLSVITPFSATATRISCRG